MTKTILVNLTGDKTETIKMPSGSTNSFVEIEKSGADSSNLDLSDAVVGGVDEVAEAAASNANASTTDKVTVTFTVKAQAEEHIAPPPVCILADQIAQL